MSSYINDNMQFRWFTASNGRRYLLTFYRGEYIKSFTDLQSAQDYMNARWPV